MKFELRTKVMAMYWLVRSVAHLGVVQNEYAVLVEC